MKKIRIISIFILIGLIIILFIPFPISSSYELDSNTLLKYTHVESFAGIMMDFEILKNGSVISRDLYVTSISKEKLRILNELIEEKEYSLKKEILLQKIYYKWFYGTCNDCGGGHFLIINNHGKTRNIQMNEKFNNIIKPLSKEVNDNIRRIIEDIKREMVKNG